MIATTTDVHRISTTCIYGVVSVALPSLPERKTTMPATSRRTKVHFHAGWSLPGCLPEMEPETFEIEAQAIAFIEQEAKDAAEMYQTDHEPSPDPAGHDNCVSCGEAIRYDESHHDVIMWEHIQVHDPYVYWVEPCGEHACVC
jgi:hypothetical protein